MGNPLKKTLTTNNGNLPTRKLTGGVYSEKMYSSLKMSSVLTDPCWFCVFLSKEMCCRVTSVKVKKTSQNNIPTEKGRYIQGKKNRPKILKFV